MQLSLMDILSKYEEDFNNTQASAILILRFHDFQIKGIRYCTKVTALKAFQKVSSTAAPVVNSCSTARFSIYLSLRISCSRSYIEAEML